MELWVNEERRRNGRSPHPWTYICSVQKVGPIIEAVLLQFSGGKQIFVEKKIISVSFTRTKSFIFFLVFTIISSNLKLLRSFGPFYLIFSNKFPFFKH